METKNSLDQFASLAYNFVATEFESADGNFALSPRLLMLLPTGAGVYEDVPKFEGENGPEKQWLTVAQEICSEQAVIACFASTCWLSSSPDIDIEHDLDRREVIFFHGVSLDGDLRLSSAEIVRPPRRRWRRQPAPQLGQLQHHGDQEPVDLLQVLLLRAVSEQALVAAAKYN